MLLKHRTDRGRKTAATEKVGSNRCGTTLTTASRCVRAPKTRTHERRHESSPSRKAVCRFFAINVQNMPVRGRYRRQIRRRKCCFSPFECDFRDVSPGRNYSTLFSITITDVAATPNRNILHIGPYFLTRWCANAMQNSYDTRLGSGKSEIKIPTACDAGSTRPLRFESQRAKPWGGDNAHAPNPQHPGRGMQKPARKLQEAPIAKNCCIRIVL